MGLIGTIVVVLPYAGYSKNDTCYKKWSNQCIKRKNYSCCEKIIKIACKCGFDGCNYMCQQLLQHKKWHITTGVMWISRWVVWGQTNRVNKHTRQALVLQTSTIQMKERGSPDLPACGLRHGSRSGPIHPIFINSSSRLSRGAKPRGADGARLPQERPHQAGSRGGGEIKAGVPRKVLVTQAMTIETRRAPACAVSLFPLWCKGGKRRCGVPRRQAKVTISVQRDQDQQSGRTEVTVVPKTVSSPVPLAIEDQL